MKRRHTKAGYFAELGRRGGQATKRNHPPAKRYYSRIGAKGGRRLRDEKRRTGKAPRGPR